MLFCIVQVYKLQFIQIRYPINNKDFFPDKFSEQNKPDVSLGFIFFTQFLKILKFKYEMQSINLIDYLIKPSVSIEKDQKFQNNKENASDFSLLWSKSWNKTNL